MVVVYRIFQCQMIGEALNIVGYGQFKSVGPFPRECRNDYRLETHLWSRVTTPWSASLRFKTLGCILTAHQQDLRTMLVKPALSVH